MKAYYEDTRESHNMFGVCADCDYPQHFNTAIEFEYVLSGCEEVTVDGKKELLDSGGVSIAFPYQAHGYRKVEEGNKFFFIAPSSILELPGKNLSHALPETPFYHYIGSDREFFEALLSPLILTAKEYGMMTADSREYYTEIIRAVILFHLEHTGYKEIIEQPLGTQLFQRIMMYLDAHYDDCDFSTEKAAREIGVSAQYLSLLVRRSTGYTLTEHLRNLRIAKARRLLRRTNMSVSEIALESGFSSIRTFNRVFAETIGKTPRDFRLKDIWD